MAERSAHINYSFEDIQRYLQGKMPAAEMHAIEKAALQDPFLADAIEGYKEVDINTAKQHLNEIHSGLFAEKKRSKLVAVNRKTQWLRIAAVIIVIAGVGVLSTYIFKNSGKQSDIAQLAKKQANEPVNKDSVSNNNNNATVIVTDTATLIAQNKPKEKATAVNSLAKGNAKAKEESIESDEVAATAAPVFRSQPEASTVDTVTFNLKTSKGLSIQPSTAFSGRVVDENNNPIAGATVESADKKTVTVTNLNGFFQLQNNDSLVGVTANAVGYENQSAYLHARATNTIVLKTDSAALNDVVISGYSNSSRLREANQAKTAPSPVGGWKNFNLYVLNQLNKDTAKDAITDLQDLERDTTEDAITNPQDLVEIEFLVDKAGTPYNFKIVKPLDDQRNAKAIEILKSGPKWTNTSKNKKAHIAISF